jgi:hypothetical protein
MTVSCETVPSGRVTVTGIVLAERLVEKQFVGVQRILVRDYRGFPRLRRDPVRRWSAARLHRDRDLVQGRSDLWIVQICPGWARPHAADAEGASGQCASLNTRHGTRPALRLPHGSCKPAATTIASLGDRSHK